MINAYEVVNGDKVLLVGEGNFSFSKDFLIFNKIGLINPLKQIEIVSSCKESIVEIFSDSKKEAINFLIEKGKVSLFYYNSSLVCLSSIYSKPKSDINTRLLMETNILFLKQLINLKILFIYPLRPFVKQVYLIGGQQELKHRY